ncbi:hypothetical protein CY34DRAFT_802675 [Suillus luteus UH-Slu-Lm8-n1]|uniref:CcmS related domain-containing protein n=1 Tax=Suillus luteus UH-Slu-Lm8-n1 TaxID=930992 RepID=A0A0D0B3D8_9AGAM|nr:hypothetical protein CY34DRAFT_802675 [Suillus luteus UH-Slu-Lm8-n1]
MPKNSNNKKGKQKETPAAPPPPPPPPPVPPPPPPPLALPPPRVMTIDTIEEEEDDFGGLGEMDAGDLNEDSWEHMHEAGDAPQDLNAWASNDPQNSNDDWANDEQWETGAPPQAQMPPRPPQKDGSNTKSQKKQQQHQHQHQQHQQHQHRQHQQHQQPQHNDGWGSGGGAWEDAGGTPAPAKKQLPKGNWSQTTQRAMDEPAWSTWGHEAGWEQGGDTSENEEEDWPAEDDPWSAPASAWPQPQSTHAPQAYAQKQPAHAPQAYAQRQPSQQSSWQTWGEEARRLPKSQQPYAATNPPPGTGGYFQPQGINKQASQPQSANTQWSQQQAVMSAEFRQQQEQAYALAQAQSQHKQLQLQQLQQQQQHRHAQQQQAAAYALAHAHSQHRQQQHHHQNQPQHDEAYGSAHANLRRQLQHHQNPNQLQHHHDPNQSQHHHDPNQSQHHQNPNQPQHEGKKHKKDKESKQSKKEKKRQQKEEQQQQEEQHDNDVWGLGEGWQDLEDDPDDYEDMHDAWGRRVHFSPPHTAPSVAPSTVVENFTVNAFPPNKLGLSTFSNTSSKTLTYAYHGTTASMENRPARNNAQDFADFIESKGAAISPVAGAFFGRERKAKERFHWMFPPDKDERVASLLAWIQSVSYGLGSFGLHKFLQTRERGALIVNADYRPSKSPNEPAFDWLTFPELQKTMDRTLQESVAFYDPSALVVVFVFLPSKSGNSLAIWRRKIAVPSNVRLAYQAQITQAIDSLSRDYSVYVDEIPPPKLEPPSSPPKKRKWWKLWLST